MTRKRFSYLLCLILFLHLFPGQTGLIKQLYPPLEEDVRPVYFYGYINNEHYKHYLPGSRVVLRGSHVVMNCPPSTYVQVTRASFGTPAVAPSGHWTPGICHYPTSLAFARSKCRNKSTCKISASPQDLPDETAPEACGGITRMILATDYTCVPITDPPALYNHDRGFIAGVTPHYLLLANRSATCAAERSLPQKNLLHGGDQRYTLSEAMATCDEEDACTFVVWEMAAEHSAVFCTDQEWEGARQKEGSFVAVKPSEFESHGYAVYLNFLGICLQDNILKKESGVRRVQEGVSMCNQVPGCSYASFSLTTGLLSLPNFTEHLWLCSGEPTMIPLDGAVFAVKVGGAESPSRASLMCLLSTSSFVQFREKQETSSVTLHHQYGPQGYPTPSQVDNRRIYGPPQSPSLSGQLY